PVALDRAPQLLQLLARRAAAGRAIAGEAAAQQPAGAARVVVGADRAVALRAALARGATRCDRRAAGGEVGVEARVAELLHPRLLLTSSRARSARLSSA